MPVTAYRFVIRPLTLDEGATAPDVGRTQPLSPLAGVSNAWVAEVKGASTFAAWQRLQPQLGRRFQALPVLSDDEGAPRYPTGRIGVRFRAPVSDAQLQSVAKSVGAQLLQRTARSDRQAVFGAADPADEYLPELVARLEQDPTVDQAWLDAQSAYRRGT